MENFTFMPALLGGMLIGVSASLLMLFKGRIAGACGMLFTAFHYGRVNPLKALFLLGIFLGGTLGSYGFDFHVLAVNSELSTGPVVVVIAGILTGIGTSMANGCTSGHGICGIARGSKRSIVATITFISAGIITTTLVHLIKGNI